MVAVFTLEGKLCREKKNSFLEKLGALWGKTPYILTGCVFVKSSNVSEDNSIPVLLNKINIDILEQSKRVTMEVHC